MRQEKISQTFVIMISIILMTIGLSGCTSTSNQNTNNIQGNTDKFLGIWTGEMQMPMFGGNNISTLSQITFMDTIAEVSLTNEHGTYTMNYSYTINGNTLVLEPKFSRQNGFPGRRSYNGSEPWNGTRPPINRNWSRNGTRPPMNGSWQPGGERPSMSISFEYQFNDEYTILYLNGAQFIKVH